MKKRKRLAAALLLCALLLSGCSIQDAFQGLQNMQTAAPGKAWKNSSIEGEIDGNTTADVRDDFYTAVNKDWILGQETDETGQNVALLEADKTVKRQMLKLAENGLPGGVSAEKVGMTEEELAHAEKLVSVFSAAAADTKKRNEMGAEPLRPYIDAIRSVGSLDAMTAFILDEGGMNIVGQPFISLIAGATQTSPENKILKASPVNAGYLALRRSGSYTSIDSAGIQNKEVFSEIITMVLRNLGWSEKEISEVLRRSYTMEYLLAKNYNSDAEYYSLEEYSNAHTEMTEEELCSLTGKYPMREILEYMGCAGCGVIEVENEAYMKAVGRVYTEANLENIKAFYITHTVYSCADLLDTATKDAVYAAMERSVVQDPEDVPDDPTGTADAEIDESGMTKKDREWQTVIDDYIMQYLPAPFEMMYIAAYCTPEQKKAVTEMTLEIKEQMRRVMNDCEWLSEEGKAGTVDKLSSMEMNILYPDEYISYLGLELYEDMSLPEMVHEINRFEMRRLAEGAGEKNDRGVWDLGLVPTTETNAYNDFTANRIMILAGIVADGFTFDPENPKEVNLARLGTIVGHEITHSFDSTGYEYDKNGFRIYYGSESEFMTAADKEILSKRILDLSLWYMALTPVPGIGAYAAPVSGEAIADFGGMKTALYVAEQEPEFDYDLFFRSYAQLWRKVCTLDVETMYSLYDEHPLAFLRTNITLQQFDKFMETYGIQESDGMYIDPEKRILVW